MPFKNIKCHAGRTRIPVKQQRLLDQPSLYFTFTTDPYSLQREFLLSRYKSQTSVDTNCVSKIRPDGSKAEIGGHADVRVI